MSQYKISKKRLAEIIKEEYQSLHELEDPRRPSPMSYEHEGAADDFRTQIMNLVLQLGPLTLDPKTASAVEIEIRDVLNTLNIGSDPRDRYRQQEAKKPDFLDLDKDGDKEEPMEDAAEDKEEKEGGKKDKKKDLSKVPPQLRKSMKKESMDSIRQLIKRELQNL